MNYAYWFPVTYGGATTFTSGWIDLRPRANAVNAVNAVSSPPSPPSPPNPYAVDPDARHIARIKRELAAPWPPKAKP